MNRLPFCSVVASLTLAFACASPSIPNPDAGGPTTGSLTVTVSGLPGTTAADVTVTGPGTYSRAVTATTTLSGLTPGTYTVSANRTFVTHPIVSTVFQGAVTGSPAGVTAGGTATTTVAFTQRPGTGQLWVADKAASSASGFDATLLTASGSPTATVGLGLPAGSQPFGILFDAQGNLWIPLPSSNKIVRFTSSSLSASGAPTETASISDSNGPSGIAFDASGNLWVQDSFNQTLVKYRASDLTGTGVLAISPVVTVTVTGGQSLDGIAFDAAGNLWVADSNFANPPYSGVIREFTAAQLSATGNVSLSSAATLTSATILASQGVAFDAAGNLWSADFGTTGADANLIRFNASQLTGTGNISSDPDLVLTSSSLGSPVSPAFDESGNLWVANHSLHTVVQFSASQVVSSGAVNLTPPIVLTGSNSSGFTGMAFDPAPAGVFLQR